MMTLRRNWLVLALIGLGPLLLFGPMLLRSEAIFWGTPLLQFVPWHDFALDAVRSGTFPFWNPQLGFGAPLFANYQSALLYPPNILLAVLGPAYGHGLLVMLHLIWAGVGMALLARRLGIAARGQIVAGMAFSLSGYLVARGSFISINHSAAWLPWIVLACERLVGSESKQSAKEHLWDVTVLGVLFGIQWLAGHAQTSWYTLVFSVAWVVWRSSQRRSWTRLTKGGLWMLAAGLIGFVLSAVQLLPTIEYLLQTQRAAGLDREFALTYSFWPWRLAGLLAPDLFGSPAAGNYWGYGNYWEDAIYIGVFPLLMAIAAIFSLGRSKGQDRGLKAFLLLAATVSMIFALGRNTPIFQFFYDHVPTFDLFQAPTRWNLIFVFCLSLLAAVGTERWKTPQGRGLYWARLGTAGAGIIGIASYGGSLLLGGVQATFVPALARAGLMLFAAGLLTLFLSKDRAWRVVLALSVYLLADLVSAGFGLNPSVDLEVFGGESKMARFVEGNERVYMPAEIEQTLKFERTHRFDTYDPDLDWRSVRDVGLPNTTMLDDVRSANNFDPFTPARYERWLERLSLLSTDDQVVVLRSAGVRWRAHTDEDGLLGVSYEDLGPVSRVQLVRQAIPVESSEEALDRLFSASYDPLDTLLIEAAAPGLAAGSGGQAEIVSQSNPNQVHIEASTEGGGWLMLSEAWYPGWKAFIDEEITDLYRADYLFMSVWVPPGDHLIEFRYQPPYFMYAAFLSAAGWLSVIGLAVRRRS